MFSILHHGATDGITRSCHELCLDSGGSILVDCGLFQGIETSRDGATSGRFEIDFPIGDVKALVVTHIHLDHVGRIPYLMAAGFRGPIFCSEPSVLLLPVLLEDAIKVKVTADQRQIDRFLKKLGAQLVGLPYGQWRAVETGTGCELGIRLKPAGHILGSAYVECAVKRGRETRRAVFSGDLGAPYSPLLPAPRSPYSAEIVVLESTYGDKNHEGRRERRERLKTIVQGALANRGTVLIPAFSIGRTQELLYDLEQVLHQFGRDPLPAGARSRFDPQRWEDLELVVDSPLAIRFTALYRKLNGYWDAEARRRLSTGRHPLSFEQLTTIDSHRDHLAAVDHLRRTARPCIVIAASGMCTGGRVVNYLKALLEDPRHDVVFVGYQARGTPGQAIQRYGPRNGYVDLDGQRYTIRARIHTLTGYSAHAGQKDLLNFIRRMRHPPREVRLVHGEEGTKRVLAAKLRALGYAACSG